MVSTSARARSFSLLFSREEVARQREFSFFLFFSSQNFCFSIHHEHTFSLETPDAFYTSNTKHLIFTHSPWRGGTAAAKSGVWERSESVKTQNLSFLGETQTQKSSSLFPLFSVSLSRSLARARRLRQPPSGLSALLLRSFKIVKTRKSGGGAVLFDFLPSRCLRL
jgi:hypothetical protein